MLTTPDILDYEWLVILTTTPNQPYFQFLKHGFENNLEKSVINKLFKAMSKEILMRFVVKLQNTLHREKPSYLLC